MSAELPWRPGTGGGLLVRVRLTPKASRDAVEGVEATAEGPALKARVRAVPENGAANDAVARLVADWLDVAKSAVTLVAGGKSRVKTLAVVGDATLLAARAATKLGVA
ncbi:MAG: DUF167 domain-containing protein [Hyphomicrobiaceae bacterium]